MMNILVIGSGGREHALVWKIAQSPLTGKLFIAPGNAGTAEHGININIPPGDFDALGKFAIENNIEMIVVGPEDPLVKGIYNFFKANDSLKDIIVIGPGKEGAMLEGSKEFAKVFMERHNIPTARYRSFTIENLADGLDYLEQMNPPYVLKADGLAAGKGVIICSSIDEARGHLRSMITDKRFGAASEKVVIEEFLDGIELSVFVITDGYNYKILPEAKDYKRIGVGDTGPNTGGMGSISPVPFADKEFMQKVETRIIEPSIRGIKEEGIAYKGFVFFGLINVKGNPFVIEYNVRMGDPEAESIIPRIKSDLVSLFRDTGTGKLSSHSLEIQDGYSATVIMVSGGYPGSYEKGKEIEKLPETGKNIIFHAGTKRSEDGTLLTNGGRVLAVTSLAGSMQEALRLSYEYCEKIHFEGCYYRNDLGRDLLK